MRRKRVWPVIAGVAVFMGIVFATDAISDNCFALPAGTDFTDKEALEAAIDALPIAASVIMLSGQALASFLGALVATLVAKRTDYLPALIVGGIGTLAGIANLMEIPHPFWFDIINVLSYLPAAYLGYLVVRKKEPLI